MNTALIRHTLVLRQQHLQQLLDNIDQGFDTYSIENIDDSAFCTTLRELAQVKRVLKKLGSRGFGICQHCGAAIEADRLKNLPCTEHCSTCAVEH